MRWYNTLLNSSNLPSQLVITYNIKTQRNKIHYKFVCVLSLYSLEQRFIWEIFLTFNNNICLFSRMLAFFFQRRTNRKRFNGKCLSQAAKRMLFVGILCGHVNCIFLSNDTIHLDLGLNPSIQKVNRIFLNLQPEVLLSAVSFKLTLRIIFFL